LEWEWTLTASLINPNENGQSYYKNIDVMIKVTSPKLPKYAVRAIISMEIKPIPPLEMGRKIC